jgi:hypothetical protein
MLYNFKTEDKVLIKDWLKGLACNGSNPELAKTQNLNANILTLRLVNSL